MSFEANEKKIREIFVGDSRFIIPRNQRKYVWDEKQWSELFEDIKYIDSITSKLSDKERKDITHFFGSFVLQEEDRKYTIIDGQQRITTIMILMSAISFIFNELENEEEFGITRQYLLGNIGLKSQYIRFENIDLINLQLLIENITEYTENVERESLFKDTCYNRNDEQNKKVLSCFWFLYNSLVELIDKYENKDEKEQYLNRIREIILDMKVIYITSEDELDCYDIFEILNARGVELKESELLKNYIYKYSVPKYTVDKSKEKWNIIESNMAKCNNNIEQFLIHYTTYRFSKPKSNESVFRIIKSNVKKSEVKELLDDIVQSSEYYKYFYNPDLHTNDTIRRCLKYFKLINHRQFRPIFLALFSANKKEKITDKEVEDTFIFLRNFYFSFGTITKNTSNKIEQKIYDYANEIENKLNNDTLKNMKNELLKYYPNKEVFISCFTKMSYSNKNKLHSNSNNKKIMDYILLEIESHFKKEKNKSTNIVDYNIEHLKLDTKEDSSAHRIGNLVLICKTLNDKMEDKEFDKKMPYLKKSDFEMVKMFVKNYGDKKEWTDENISKRGEKLAQLAYSKIWNI